MKPQSTVKQEIDRWGPVAPPCSSDGGRKNVRTSLSANCWIRSGLIALSIMGLRGGVLAQAASSAHRACEIRAREFEGWKAQEISSEWLRLIIVPQLGGRLMQVRFDGHEFLFVNPEYKGRYFPPTSANGKWFNYGGDKIWPMPEGRDDAQHWPGPISDERDDGDYQFNVISRSPSCAIRLDGPPSHEPGCNIRARSRSAGTRPKFLFSR